ncbi:putative hydrolase of the HAD superfamily [Methanolobus profundi]|uniref:Putative hydrolase of the HAD superfamily n=2 Tax=Methanolobus profundi TaxID=487685 RepID=A0A1I4USC4_9EURY|nr:putative hydrolase of the HAD superfamily [Methanolobus profundi]
MDGTIMTGELKGVIFDMDNTLFDFIEAKITACTAIVEFIGKGEAHELLSYFRRKKYGFEDLENISDYLIEYDMYSEQMFNDCCAIYEREKISTIELYPGVKDTMLDLKEMELSIGILTDADKNNASKRLRKVGLCGCFDSLFTYDMTGHKKPSHEPFTYALDSMGLKAYETLYVGDSLRRDIIPSKQIGMVTVHALYGDYSHPDDNVQAMERPDHTINAFRELLTIIQNGNRS